MSVTCRQILRITEGVNGSSMLHLQDNEGAAMTAAWMEQHRPEVGGYLLDNGRGEVWFAKNSLSTLPAVLVEVQRITAKPGELVVFQSPNGSVEDGERLCAFITQAVPGLNFVVVTGDSVNITVIDASLQTPACSQSLLADGKPAPADCARCGLLGPCTEKVGEPHP
jgi:hypothetical protein